MQRNALGAVESAFAGVEPVGDLDFPTARTALLLASLPVLLVEGRPGISVRARRQPSGSAPIRVSDALIVRLTQDPPPPSRWGINE